MNPKLIIASLPLKTIALASCFAAASLVLGTTGCANMDTANAGAARSAGVASDDQNLSDLVRAALSADTEYKFDGVKVETFNSTVQLSGFVASDDQKTRAGDRASKVAGVKSVENNITIKS